MAAPLTNGRVNAVAFGKDDSNLIYVGTTNGDLFMSEDFGATFVDISAGLPNRAVTHISVSPDNNYDILVSLSGSNSDKVFNTNDTKAGNVTWVSRSGAGQGALPDVSVNAIARDPS